MLSTQNNTHSAKLVETFSEVLETMAFVWLQPTEEIMVPENLLLLTMDFQGPIHGELQLFAPQSLGALLAGNMLGTTAEDPLAEAGARDALKELLNIACGTLLRKLAPADARFHVSLPKVTEVSDREQWYAAIGRGDLTMLDAEGRLLGVRLETLG